jgi:enoyl-CoA hydratase
MGATDMIEREQHGDVVVLRLNHGRVNALDLELLTELVDMLEELAADAPPLVLTGAGSSFSAGVDLRRLIEGEEGYVERFLPALSAAFLELFTYPGPTVAAVNGHAIAGGYVLVAACDVRLAADTPSRLGLSELRVGVPFPATALEILRASVGTPAASTAILSADLFAPAVAARLGLIDDVVDPASLQSAAVSTAQTRAALGQPAYHLAKAALHAPTLTRIAAADDTWVNEAWADPTTWTHIKTYMEGLRD